MAVMAEIFRYKSKPDQYLALKGILFDLQSTDPLKSNISPRSTIYKGVSGEDASVLDLNKSVSRFHSPSFRNTDAGD